MASRKPGKGASGTNGKELANSQNVLDLLRHEHEQLKSRTDQLKQFQGCDAEIKSLKELFSSWNRYTEAKFDVFYPALKQAGVDAVAIAEAVINSDLIAILLGELASCETDDENFRPLLVVLEQTLQRVIDFEENDQNGLFAKAKQAEIDLKGLGKSYQNRLSRIGHRAEETPAYPLPRYLRSAGFSRPKEFVPMRGHERDRDERGRFVEEDDRGSRSHRGRESDDDERRSSMRDRDDDERSSRRYSEAGRRGWETRRSERYEDDDDDRRGSYRGRSNYETMSRVAGAEQAAGLAIGRAILGRRVVPSGHHSMLAALYLPFVS